MKKISPLLFGTILLTAAGLLSRFLGFFYRIWLAGIIGETGLGMFQMIFPVFGLALSLCTSGIPMAISRFTAEALADGDQAKSLRVLQTGLLSSLALSILSALLLHRESGFLAGYLLSSPELAGLFSVLAIALPPAAVHSCIDSYYLGRKNAAVSATSQLIEQCVRILATLMFCQFFLYHSYAPNAFLPVMGMAAGEAAALLFVVCSLAVTVHKIRGLRRKHRQLRHCGQGHGPKFLHSEQKHEQKLLHSGQGHEQKLHHSGQEHEQELLHSGQKREQEILHSGQEHRQKIFLLPSGKNSPEYRQIFRNLSAAACPLTMQRVLSGALGSLEAILLPFMLQKYGMTRDSALGIYGVLTGMAMPCIFFPSAITNSMSAMLMPIVAEANVRRDHQRLSSAIKKTAAISAAVGIACFLGFLLFGQFIGSCILKSETAGGYLRVLAWLCPFLYLNATFGSILNGLGRSGLLFLISILCTGLRLVCILILVPCLGIYGHLLGLLLSTILQTFLNVRAIRLSVPAAV